METTESYLSPEQPTATVELTLGELRAFGALVMIVNTVFGSQIVRFMPSQAASLAYGRFLQKMFRAFAPISTLSPEELEEFYGQQAVLDEIYDQKTSEILQALDQAVLGVSIEGPDGERIDPTAFSVEEESS